MGIALGAKNVGLNFLPNLISFVILHKLPSLILSVFHLGVMRTYILFCDENEMRFCYGCPGLTIDI